MKLLQSTQESGITLIEVLVAMLLFSLVGLSMAQSAMVSMRAQVKAELGNQARNLAVSKAEELSGVPYDELDDSYDETEDDLLVVGHQMTFTRITNVTINTDNSRTIDIAVSGNSSLLPNAITYTTRFAPWE